MPVGLYTGPNTHTGNGVTTVFAYDFKILQSADLKVTVDGVVTTTGFTVSGAGSSGGGSITFSSAPANGVEIVLSRSRAYNRTTDYQRNGSFDEETVDADFDVVVMLIQQLDAAQKRAIKVPESVSADQVISSVDWAARASKFFGFNSGGALALFAIADVAPTAVSAFIATLIDDPDAATARATLQAAGLGANTFTGVQRWAKGADVASAAALTLGTDGNYFDITGTTPITSIGTLGVGTMVGLHFDDALTLTHHATDLILPGGANITTAAGDEAIFVEYAAGDWRCLSYTRASGLGLPAATQAQQETGTSNAVAVTPGRQQYHPSAAKAWIEFNGTGTPAVLASYNMDSSSPITDHGTGDYTLNIGTDFSIAAFSYAPGCGDSNRTFQRNGTMSAGSWRGRAFVTSDLSASDVASLSCVFYGDQS